jgi:alcohol dehydrogenase class IV
MSGASRIVAEIQASAKVHRWSNFDPNPDTEQVARGLRELVQFNPDVVIGIGGGTVLDMAKLLCAFDGVDTHEALKRRIESGWSPAARRRKLILTPTTAGSGSEATRFAVVYIGHSKFSVTSHVLLPDFVILDPDLSKSGSSHLKAASGIDAVSQAIESLWAVGATTSSKALAKAALDELIPALNRWVGGDVSAGGGVVAGSYLAGRAIDISRTTGAHALSYAITQTFGASHGDAVALTLPAFAALHDSVSTGGELQGGISLASHRHAMMTIASSLGVPRPLEISTALRQLCIGIGLEPGLSRLGAVESDLEHLALDVNTERLANNPVMLSRTKVEQILRESL